MRKVSLSLSLTLLLIIYIYFHPYLIYIHSPFTLISLSPSPYFSLPYPISLHFLSLSPSPYFPHPQSHPPREQVLPQCLLCLLTLAHHQDLQHLPPQTAAALTTHTHLLKGVGGLAREKSVAALMCPYVEGYVR